MNSASNSDDMSRKGSGNILATNESKRHSVNKMNTTINQNTSFEEEREFFIMSSVSTLKDLKK